MMKLIYLTQITVQLFVTSSTWFQSEHSTQLDTKNHGLFIIGKTILNSEILIDISRRLFFSLRFAPPPPLFKKSPAVKKKKKILNFLKKKKKFKN